MEVNGTEGRRRKRLKYIAVLPTAVTLLNALCGFVSIVLACRGGGAGRFMEMAPFHKAGFSFFAASGYFIVFAMIADILDGQVARWSGAASGFGGQLDSLSDVISFGVAPALLAYRFMETHLGLEGFMHKFLFPVSLLKGFSPGSRLAHLAGRWLLFLAILYVLCAVIRLARFNVENDTDAASHQFFAGLPTPAAAGVVISPVIFQESFLPLCARRLPELAALLTDITTWLIPCAVLGSGILMVSRFRYPHLANRLLRGKKSFFTVLLLLFAVMLALWNIQVSLLLGFWGFAALGVFRSLWEKFRGAKTAANPEESGGG
ncbi:MAG: CDP-alcohol phosphatidyltransferase family protein [Treponema sp.]|jgi:CDP-diacylglycerol--serine O-phosphatidyltransferase|nr:CDP-alcohol phosphatidyltransferase family protein [Treponema sp.]